MPPEDPICGNGELDPGEECDLGDDNDNLGECRKDCLLPICGDGFEQPGELCDDGPLNHPNAYDGCTPDCTPGPSCGDGETDLVNEECDASNPNDQDVIECVDCKLAAKRIFATKALFQGSLGGLDGADAACQDSASEAGLTLKGQVYRAWLSDGETSAAQRLVPSDVPYILPHSATAVADDWVDLTDGALAHAIDVDEYGDEIASDFYVWTNTTANGFSAGADCQGWTTSQILSQGVRGRLNTKTSEWTDSAQKSPANCSSSSRLYCVEQ